MIVIFFHFLLEKLTELGSDISNSFKPFIRKNKYVFNLVDSKLKV